MLELKNIYKKYKIAKGEAAKPVLKKISLSVQAGDFIAIMGKSGCGKSTLLNIIGCLDGYTSGEYRINGQEAAALTLTQKAQLRSKTFGFVFQSFNLLCDRTVLQNVILPLEYSQVPKAQHKTLAMNMLTKLNIDLLANKMPQTLSGGEQQRVAIARALINSPDIILADEPTGNLDSETGRHIMKTLCELHDNGKTIIFVTHDVKIAGYADKLIELNGGEIENIVCRTGVQLC